nr:MAG TPA: hypothetical protein [Caudoviricetes sp.]
MTYGEAMVRQQESQRMENGVWVFDELEPYEPFATSTEAYKYYGEKLDRYWLSKIELSPSSKFSKQDVLQILKGRNLNGEPELHKDI